MEYARRSGFWVASLASLLLAVLAVSQWPERGLATTTIPRPARVLLLGVDGLEWDVVLPLLREGRMPALAGLIERGRAGQLDTFAPALSPVIWTSMATGKTPEKHGIRDFVRRDAAGRTVTYTSSDRKTKALWNILSDAGRPMITIGWWNTWPVEPVRGILVSQPNSLEAGRTQGLAKGMLRRGEQSQIHPAALEEPLLRIVDQVEADLQAVFAETYSDFPHAMRPALSGNWAASSWALRSDEINRRVAIAIATAAPSPDLFTVYLSNPDVVGHRFWRHHRPEEFAHPPAAEDLAGARRVIADAYARVDQAIGELSAMFPPDTTIMVVSDHGMHAENREKVFRDGGESGFDGASGGHPDAPPGMIVAAGRHIAAGPGAGSAARLTRQDLPRLGSVLDVCPTLLALLDLPVGRDMDGKVMTALFAEDRAARLEVKYVDSHDTDAWRASRREQDEVEPGLPERLEQLRALGYIGGESAAPPAGARP